MLPIAVLLALQLPTNQNVIKTLYFKCLTKMFICTLNLRGWITQICDFKLAFNFFKFWTTSSSFQKLGVSPSNYELNCVENPAYFFRGNVLVCCWAKKQCSKIATLFWKIRKECPWLSVNETKPGSENASNCNYFDFGANKK